MARARLRQGRKRIEETLREEKYEEYEKEPARGKEELRREITKVEM